MDTYLIKLGGNTIRREEDLVRLSSEISGLIAKGARAVLVHGGGPEISEEMEARGMRPKMVRGLRLTDESVLEVTEYVLKDLNSKVVGCLESAGIRAKGVPGYGCTLCERKYLQDSFGRVDLGLVGEVAKADPMLLQGLLDAGITPVVYPIGKDSEGCKLNVNADAMASGIAAGLGCRELITVTDVPGILADPDDPSSKLDSVTLEEIDEMIADGTVHGGMVPKVEACRNALMAGVRTVRMLDGKDSRNLLSDVMDGIPHGTVIRRQEYGITGD